MLAGAELMRVVDDQLRVVSMPVEGILLSDYLAGQLGVRSGDSLQVEVLEGQRTTRTLMVAGVVREYIGAGAYMALPNLNYLLREGPAMNSAVLATVPGSEASLQQRMRDAPMVASLSFKSDSIAAIRTQMDETVLMFALINFVLALSITFAVVYNNARIAFAERARELATLRVLGFHRSEVAYILFGELLILTILALPLGAALGFLFAWLIATAMATDLFRIPLVITSAEFAQAALAVMVATCISLGLLLRRLYRLDMVSALKNVD